jgi:hypothetical protein
MLERTKKDKTIDIFNYVQLMRSNRITMVQTDVRLSTRPMLDIEVLHDHVRAAMLDGRTTESLSPEELNSFSCKHILLFLPSNMAAVT